MSSGANPSPIRPREVPATSTAVAPEEVHNVKGGRRVELYVPVEYNGRKHSVVDIGPCKLDHVMRWNEGKILGGAMALLADLTGLEQGALRELRYPDADRVMAAFVGGLPQVIRSDIENGVSPASRTVNRADQTMPEGHAEEEIEDAGHGFDNLTGE